MTKAATSPAAMNAPIVVAVCFAIAALEGYDIQALGVAAPSMGAALKLSKDTIGLAGSAAMIGLVIGSIFGGWLADRAGRKPVLIASTAWFGVFSIATALAFDANTLILTRLAIGLGFGGAMPNMIAVALEISGPRRRAATVTTMFVGMPVGGALSALVTRIDAVEADWRLVFIVGGVLPLLVAPLGLWLLPETRPDHEETADRRSLPALFGGGRALITPLMWLAFGLTLLVQYVMLNWLPTLVIAKGLSKDVASLAALAFNLSGVVGGVTLGLTVDRFGYRWPLAAAYLGLVAVMAGLAAAAGTAAILTLAGLAGFLLMGGLFCLYALGPTHYPPAVRGVGSGAAVSAGRLGSIIGPAFAGFLLAGGASAGQVVQSIVPVVVAAGFAAVLLAVLGKRHGG
jgi:AAHS family 3-hydroxyphenylpropionic acid transporter